MTEHTVLTTRPTGTTLDQGLERFRVALRAALAYRPGPAAELPDPLHGVEISLATLGLAAEPVRPTGSLPPAPSPSPAHTDTSTDTGTGTGDPAPSRSTRPVLPVHLHGDTALIGPAPTPTGGSRPCARCLRLRWTALRPARERRALERATGRVTAGPGSPIPPEWGAPAVAAALRRLIEPRTHPHPRPAAEGPGTPAGTARPTDLAEVLEVDLRSGAVTRFTLLAHRACPDCAPPRPDAPPSAQGFPRPRPVPRPGAARQSHWSDLPLPVDALTNRLCGAIAGSTAHNRISVGVNAPVSGRLRLGGHTTENTGLYETTWGGHADTYRESLALGLLEGLERYAGQRPLGRAALTRASLSGLRAAGRPVLDPRDTVGYPPGPDPERGPGSLVAFHPDLVLDWVPGHSFARGGPVLVPAQLAYYGPQRRGEQFLLGSSNGCATGTTLEEAALHGLLELVERDAFTAAWFAAAELPEIDPATCADPATAAAVDRMRALGHHVRLFDLRLDLPIPVALCAAVRTVPGPGNLVLSAGVDLDPRAAVRTAVREVASFLPGFDERVTEDLDRLRTLAADHSLVTALEDHGMLYGLPEMAAHVPFLRPRTPAARPRSLDETFADWSPPRHTDLTDTLRTCVDLVRRQARDVVVVDQTCTEQEAVGVRTAAVIAPGLLPIDFGQAHQRAPHTERLRTAAWRAGKRAAPLAEHEIHRYPHPFL
ncbi:TOMM precursor leader peptide-binding protein (plasmid) [Streptomyces sp. BI20]|uniref:TOMM precursor leader peptide-binding protein n=1 Tax=Streptomyces sp. BI20 TaxID=3403460 RepID=UPI003C784AED